MPPPPLGRPAGGVGRLPGPPYTPPAPPIVTSAAGSRRWTLLATTSPPAGKFATRRAGPSPPQLASATHHGLVAACPQTPASADSAPPASPPAPSPQSHSASPAGQPPTPCCRRRCHADATGRRHRPRSPTPASPVSTAACPPPPDRPTDSRNGWKDAPPSPPLATRPRVRRLHPPGEMGVLSTLLGFCGFGVGVWGGVVVGYYLFIYFQPADVKHPTVRPLVELDSKTLEQMLPEIPLWVKNPDFDRIDWLNKFIEYMWPYLDKAICKTAREVTKPIIAENCAKYKIESIEFHTLTLGSLPPTFQGMKAYETDEKELIMEPSLKWAGNPNIIVVVKAFGLKATLQ
ncbi:uncharacterized protein A4U43_C04F21140 [Asparagus officinalis]|uniref:SMP-LTD domain-containing protein n=1 Tax=Asparagus officinalis TaxID=4686 RepID=A0A5P1F2N5_ASPOF|nr:uncharacterized protein A4U43_C04F21140 [Asparagus officinalis]